MKAWIAAFALLFAAPLAAQPQDITAPGTVAHRAAATGFPETVGDFRRSQVIRYGESDISANYDLQRGTDRLRLSIYIYPSPSASPAQRASACRTEMGMVAQSIDQQYSGAKQVEAGDAEALPGTEAGLRLRSVHEIYLPLRSPNPEPVRSESRLFCFVGGDWLVKIRASSNAGFEVGAIIDAFVRAGPWPGRRPGEVALR